MQILHIFGLSNPRDGLKNVSTKYLKRKPHLTTIFTFIPSGKSVPKALKIGLFSSFIKKALMEETLQFGQQPLTKWMRCMPSKVF